MEGKWEGAGVVGEGREGGGKGRRRKLKKLGEEEG